MPPSTMPERVIPIGTNKFWVRIKESGTDTNTWIVEIRARRRKGFQLTRDLVIQTIFRHDCPVIKSVSYEGNFTFSIKLRDGYRRSSSIAKELMELVNLRLRSIVPPASPVPTPIPAYVARANSRSRGSRTVPLAIR